MQDIITYNALAVLFIVITLNQTNKSLSLKCDTTKTVFVVPLGEKADIRDAIVSFTH